VKAHGDAMDKGDELAILHPLAVMLAVRDAGISFASPEEHAAALAVAVLHDVVEDCGVTVTEVNARFGCVVADAVDAISRRQGERYIPDYIARVKQNAIATEVKLADLAHNSSPQRMMRLPESERSIIRRYDRARGILAAGPEVVPAETREHGDADQA